MFSHVILGLLRDGTQRHGYELITQYRLRSGNKISPGNFYRELTRLGASGYVQTGINPPGADTRRIPYQLTERGRHEFDRWLTAPSREEGDLASWLLFVDRVPRHLRDEILQRYRDDLWVKSKVLTRAREDALRDAAQDGDGAYRPLPIILTRRLKEIAAELDFLDEFRDHLTAWDEQHDRIAEEQGAPPVVGVSVARPKRRVPAR
jgi:DNA-binding PadR family transcriptional regulator